MTAVISVRLCVIFVVELLIHNGLSTQLNISSCVRERHDKLSQNFYIRRYTKSKQTRLVTLVCIDVIHSVQKHIISYINGHALTRNKTPIWFQLYSFWVTCVPKHFGSISYIYVIIFSSIETFGLYATWTFNSCLLILKNFRKKLLIGDRKYAIVDIQTSE